VQAAAKNCIVLRADQISAHKSICIKMGFPLETVANGRPKSQVLEQSHFCIWQFPLLQIGQLPTPRDMRKLIFIVEMKLKLYGSSKSHRPDKLPLLCINENKMHIDFMNVFVTLAGATLCVIFSTQLRRTGKHLAKSFRKKRRPF